MGANVDALRTNSILVAVRPRANDTLAAALASEFALTFCQSVAQAQSQLARRHFDLILCGVNFDESRMFDLLHHAKSDSGAKAIPFVCIKVFEGILHTGSYESVKQAGGLKGIAAFVDLAQWQKEFGKQQAEAQLRNTLHQLMPVKI